MSDAQWTSTSSGAQTVYGEGSSTVYQGSSDEVENLAIYGRLYNWYAVNDSRGLCPSGFHVPSDGEWMTLEMALGMTSSQANSTGWRGTDQGAQLKTPSWGGTNSSGFSALPSGGRNRNEGYFGDYGNAGYWWSSSPNGIYAWARYLGSGNSYIYRDSNGSRSGYTVRCLRDSETEACLDPDGDGVCAENEVSGCTDSSASNFNPAATEADESCVFPGPAQCGGLSTITFDGHTYALVGIGTQCWFAENLRSDNYLNGDPIPGGLNDFQWTSTTSGAQTVYGEGNSYVNAGNDNEVANLATYGRLYNWYAINDSRGICPPEFHVPSNEEWLILENSLGGSAIAATYLKSSPAVWDGNNSSGFSGLPGGTRLSGTGNYDDEGNGGQWWTSTVSGSNAWSRYMHTGFTDVHRYPDYQRYGFSVRCIRD
jgi:uncharacterized protein (TIGR02145 family)